MNTHGDFKLDKSGEKKVELRKRRKRSQLDDTGGVAVKTGERSGREERREWTRQQREKQYARDYDRVGEEPFHPWVVTEWSEDPSQLQRVVVRMGECVLEPRAKA